MISHASSTSPPAIAGGLCFLIDRSMRPRTTSGSRSRESGGNRCIVRAKIARQPRQRFGIVDRPDRHDGDVWTLHGRGMQQRQSGIGWPLDDDDENRRRELPQLFATILSLSWLAECPASAAARSRTSDAIRFSRSNTTICGFSMGLMANPECKLGGDHPRAYTRSSPNQAGSRSFTASRSSCNSFSVAGTSPGRRRRASRPRRLCSCLAVGLARVAEDQPGRHAVLALRHGRDADPVVGRRRRAAGS